MVQKKHDIFTNYSQFYAFFYKIFEWNSKGTTIFNTGVFSLSLTTLDILVKNHIIGIAVLPIYMEGDF